MPTAPNCTQTDCPAVDTLHMLGDNECGYLNADGTPLLKNANDPYTCRRPYCTHTVFTPERRLAHEKDATKHPAKGGLTLQDRMTFICDWTGHANALQEAGLCPVCQ